VWDGQRVPLNKRSIYLRAHDLRGNVSEVYRHTEPRGQTYQDSTQCHHSQTKDYVSQLCDTSKPSLMMETAKQTPMLANG
jgi:hypothetical protein